ncbi:hypothetical protein LOK49_LG04G02533 [Camellia lanceoleosa]|uniref:Uncharacterized protein n=1 Tax=Camellia lanceoleosa TaxID=1840588 RepID=A0ACC0HWR8_9ERIC|nr:hypothetical protein LOK49_LG04G02533 [Camellia lanceoleosa]
MRTKRCHFVFPILLSRTLSLTLPLSASSRNPPTRSSQVASSRNPPTVLRLASPPPQPSGLKSQPSHCASIGFTTTIATVIIINFFEPPPAI